ncbi:MAG: 50S ribosomal protein L9 [Deltaproteobacteria bacterium]|nr:50S ribosomal protein L9 [Deltaproteobacteria bacterium]
MQVILKESIKSLGGAGDVVNVKDGFARNFLFPQGKAVHANPANLKELEHHKKVISIKQSKLKKEAEVLAEKVVGLSITIRKEAGEEDKLFGSVTTKDIADALRAENFLIDKKLIHLKDPIRQLGVTEVPVRLHPEVTATLKVWVVKA